MSKKYYLTPDHISEIKKDYHNTPTKDLAVRYECSVNCIYNLAFRWSLKKDLEFIRDTSRERASDPKHGGRKTCFKKGLVPQNKGKKQIDYMIPEAIEKTKATRFKKGNIPQNHKQIGYERICSKDGYIYIKTAEPNIFHLKHRVIWEQQNGPNTDINNLYLISRSEQLKTENSLYRYPEELVKVIRLNSSIKRQINKKRKNG